MKNESEGGSQRQASIWIRLAGHGGTAGTAAIRTGYLSGPDLQCLTITYISEYEKLDIEYLTV
jgi:hypothetical protein